MKKMIRKPLKGKPRTKRDRANSLATQNNDEEALDILKYSISTEACGN